mgnify:CR=1 FL=1
MAVWPSFLAEPADDLQPPLGKLSHDVDEQFYPFPEKDLEAALAAFPAKTPVVWVQEEPANMGAWWFLRTRFCDGIYGRPFTSVSRADSPSPAVGSSKVHRREQEALVATALGV